MKRLLTFLLFTPLFSVAQKLKIANHANAVIFIGTSKQQIKDSITKAGFTVVDKDSITFCAKSSYAPSLNNIFTFEYPSTFIPLITLKGSIRYS